MKFDVGVFLLVLAAATALVTGQQEGTRGRSGAEGIYAVEATAGGNLAAWPSGSFPRGEIWKWFAAAEADVAARGEVTPATLQQLPRGKASPALTAKTGGAAGWSVQTGLLLRTAADGSCARGQRRCGLRSTGGACDAASQDCACACIVQSGPGQPAAALWKERRNALPFMAVVSGPQDLEAAISQLAARASDYFFKIELR